MESSNNKVAVLLPLVFRKTFDYLVPEEMAAKPGDYVQVPFGSTSVYGVVWDKAAGEVDENKIKPIQRLSAHLPPMSEAMRKFIDWVAWYTLAPRGQVLKMALPLPEALEPPKMDAKYRIKKVESRESRAEWKLTPTRSRILAYLSDDIARSAKEITTHAKVSAAALRDFIKTGALTAEMLPSQIPTPLHSALDSHHSTLSPAQSSAAKHLREKLAGGFCVTVLDGVTGSGKTEVYFDSIEACIRQNKQALVMLPEIALSVQWLKRFEKRFGFAPDVWHSSVTFAKKRASWRGVAEGSTRVIVGARSALFLPFRNLGLIVVDEEHDASYKQEEGVIYHARDMAVARARHEKIPAILVSATPSLETEFNITHKRYERVHLPTRHNAADMPEIRLIDMRRQKMARNHWISDPLKTALIETLADGNQAMVFMNRRGYAPLMLCHACGHRFQCPHCTSWLVLHRARGTLLCHHCGHTSPVPGTCPDCKAENSLIPYGTGVERVAEELRELFPNARIGVMTSDSIMGGAPPPISLREIPPTGSSATPPARTHAANVISDMMEGEIDILVGTQMVAKGHHFAGLALVGVIDADMGLAGGDLRAGERTYQLLHQLSGRAGREKTKGTVYLQTYMPEHPVMQALKAGDRDAFMRLEAQMREDAAMPPYGKLASVIIEGKDEQQVARFARELVVTSGKWQVVRKEPENLSLAACHLPLVLGPAPAPLSRLKNKYRYRILIKAGRGFALQEWLSGWLLSQKIPSSLKLKVDVEPYSFV